MMLAAIVLFSNTTSFPGWIAALPVCGSVLVLAAGTATARVTPARLLSHRAVTFIGRVSYGWYLWHWPALYIERTINGGRAVLIADIGAAIASLALAALTYFVLERLSQEFRHSRFVRANAWRVVAIGIAGSLLVAASSWAVASLRAGGGGELERLHAQEEHHTLGDCRPPLLDRDGIKCFFGVGNISRVAIWGDSHVGNVIHGARAVGTSLGVGATALFYYGCAPLVGWSVYKNGVRLRL